MAVSGTVLNTAQDGLGSLPTSFTVEWVADGTGAPASGNHLIAVVVVSKPNETVTVAGYTSVGGFQLASSAFSCHIFRKVAGGSEASAVATIGSTGNSGYMMLAEFDSTDLESTPTTAFDEDEANVNTNVTTQDSGSVTAGAFDALALAVFAVDNASTWDAPGAVSYTNSFVHQHEATTSTSTARPNCWIASKVVASGAATTACTTTQAGCQAYGAMLVFDGDGGGGGGGSTPRMGLLGVG